MRKQDNSKHAAAAPPEDAPPVAESEVKRASPPRDGIVLVCMTIVSTAIAAMLYAQFAVALPWAATAGICAWAVFLLVHKHVQKSQQIAQLQAELARSRPKNGRATGAHATASPAAAQREPAAKIKSDAPVAPAAGPSNPATSGPLGSPSGEFAGVPAVLRRDVVPDQTKDAAPKFSGAPKAGQPEEQRGRAAAHDGGSSPASPLPDGPVWRGPPVSPSADTTREQWAFRPRGDNPSSLPGFGQLGGSPSASTASTVEGDLELVQRKIKALADEVNFGQGLRSAPRSGPDLHARATAEALEDSIGALKAAAGNMRDRRASGQLPTLGDSRPGASLAPTAPPSNFSLGEVVIPSTAQTIASSTHGAPSPGFEPRLPGPPLVDFGAPPAPKTPMPSMAPAQPASPIGRAIDENAIDMFLSPIVALQANDVGHYDVSMKLRDGYGGPLEVSQADLAALDADTQARFDVARLNRAAQLIQKMEARSRSGYLLTDLTSASLTNRSFLEAFARLYEERPRISQQLVLSFSQEAIGAAVPEAWQSLRDMNSIGFRFALNALRHVRTDFAALAAVGFAFVRIDAGALVHGLQTGERLIMPEELSQRTALAGLTVIASGVETAQTQATLVATGVGLGEGLLFGPPRPVNVGDGPNGRSAAA